MKSSAKKIELASVDDLFSTEEGRQDAKLEKIQEIPLSELHPFRNHPFKVKDDEAMMETADSIKQYGVLVPAIARPDPEGGYELVAGHRRHRASELAGKETMPVIVRDLDDDAATIIMVDSNLQRESLLPSERAFAYKMKLDAMKRQAGRPSKENVSQVGTQKRSDQLLAEQVGQSRNQIQRYIRLTELIPELLDMVDVRFSYDGKTDVLQGVNLKIRDGERMALVGQSGAGKSTVIELISRFYDVQEGEVLIGGINVNELNYDTILKNIAIVFQKTFLTRDSVLENIRMGSDASLEEVRAAAREAQIDDFIMSLPDGYDTKVGSFGSRFSGGEKQRIAIARAILKNAPILILDEATSASDPENQMEIDKAIQNLCKGRTVIVVAHRLSALKMCDRVAVVENHTITSVGTHEEVRKENAYYRKAWEDYETARGITYQLEGGGQNESE